MGSHAVFKDVGDVKALIGAVALILIFPSLSAADNTEMEALPLFTFTDGDKLSDLSSYPDCKTDNGALWLSYEP